MAWVMSSWSAEDWDPNKGPTTMEAMSTASTSSNKMEEAMVSVDGRTREERNKLVMQAVTNTNGGKVPAT